MLDKNGKELELTDKGDGRFTFIMPAGRVEVKAAFTEEVKISPSGMFPPMRITTKL